MVSGSIKPKRFWYCSGIFKKRSMENNFTYTFRQLHNHYGAISSAIKKDTVQIQKNGCLGIPAKSGVNVQQVYFVVARPPTHAIFSRSQNTAIILTSDIPGASLFFSTQFFSAQVA
jgi:hypothetical protein